MIVDSVVSNAVFAPRAQRSNTNVGVRVRPRASSAPGEPRTSPAPANDGARAQCIRIDAPRWRARPLPPRPGRPLRPLLARLPSAGRRGRIRTATRGASRSIASPALRLARRARGLAAELPPRRPPAARPCERHPVSLRGACSRPRSLARALVEVRALRRRGVAHSYAAATPRAGPRGASLVLDEHNVESDYYDDYGAAARAVAEPKRFDLARWERACWARADAVTCVSATTRAPIVVRAPRDHRCASRTASPLGECASRTARPRARGARGALRRR